MRILGNRKLSVGAETTASSEPLKQKRQLKNQLGIGLIEMMIAMALSLMAVGIMVVLMASTLGTGTATIHMSRL